MQIGDRVRCKNSTGNSAVTDKFGMIIGFVYDLKYDDPLVEFDENINGHDGLGKCSVSGKHGHCWFVPRSCIELIVDDVIPDRLSISFDEII